MSSIRFSSPRVSHTDAPFNREGVSAVLLGRVECASAFALSAGGHIGRAGQLHFELEPASQSASQTPLGRLATAPARESRRMRRLGGCRMRTTASTRGGRGEEFASGRRLNNAPILTLATDAHATRPRPPPSEQCAPKTLAREERPRAGRAL